MGRGWLRKVRKVKLVLLHRGRAMDFAVGLLPFQDGIAAAGAVGGRGGGRCSGLGVDAVGLPREAAGGRARSVWCHRLIFFKSRCMVPAFCKCKDARGAWEAAASGTLQHQLWGARAGPVPAIQAGTMALLGAAAGEGVERVVRSLSQGRRRSVDLATVWLHYDCGIAACDAGSTDRGTGGGWGVDGASWPRRETARQLPRPRNSLLGGAPPPSMFSRWGHVTRLHNIIGWLFRPLCVTMAYGLRMSRLGASEGVLHRS